MRLRHSRLGAGQASAATARGQRFRHECKHAYQSHLKPGLRVRGQLDVAPRVQGNLVPELHLFRIESTGQCRNRGAIFLDVDTFCAKLRDRATRQNRKQLGEDRLRRCAGRHERAR